MAMPCWRILAISGKHPRLFIGCIFLSRDSATSYRSPFCLPGWQFRRALIEFVPPLQREPGCRCPGTLLAALHKEAVMKSR